MKQSRTMIKLEVAATLFGSSVILYALAANVDGFANWYFTHIYRYLSSVISWVTGLFPFSVVEFLLYTMILVVVIVVVRTVHKVVRKKSKFRPVLINGSLHVLLFLGAILFLYVINCGINYHRDSFIQLENIEETHYGRDELVEVCNTLTKEINQIQERLQRGDDGLIIVSDKIKSTAREEMKALSKRYPSLKGYYPDPKPLVVSELLSYQQVSGIYSPFTVEANYNNDMPEYLKPYTICHELSHLKGVMREEEANYVAFLACMDSDDPVFKYSGLMHAYTKCMSELSNYDAEEYKTIRSQLNEGSNADIVSKYEFWERYEGKIATLSNKMNDAYLKANSQTAGVDSYNQVTGLIVTYFIKMK